MIDGYHCFIHKKRRKSNQVKRQVFFLKLFLSTTLIHFQQNQFRHLGRQTHTLLMLIIILTFCFPRYEQHCVKGVHIRSYSGPHFPAFGLNTVSVFSPNVGKCGPELVRIQTLFTQRKSFSFSQLNFLISSFPIRKAEAYSKPLSNM